MQLLIGWLIPTGIFILALPLRHASGSRVLAIILPLAELATNTEITCIVQVMAMEPRQLISRPASPTLSNESTSLVNGGAVLAAALQKKMNRKRKANSLESEVCISK